MGKIGKKHTLPLLSVGLLILIVLLSVLLFTLPKPHVSGQPYCTKCNVILISVDSVRADHVGAYGYARNTTPNFDALAKQSALFTNYFGTSYLTPVSEVSVHTGRYPTNSGVAGFDMILPKDRATLAEVFKTAGYRTAALSTSPEFFVHRGIKDSLSRGFDVYQSTKMSDLNKNLINRDLPTDEEIASFIDKNSGSPSFMWLALGNVHWPYGLRIPEHFRDPAYTGGLKKVSMDWSLFRNFYNGIRYPEKTALSQDDAEYITDTYDDGIFAFDAFLGKLIALLKERKMLENTIIIIQSEHGEDLGEHGYFAHYDIFDTQTHVPLLIYVPTVNGTRIDSLASGVDIAPTVTALVGVTGQKGYEGENLSPLLEGKNISRDAVYLERTPLWEEAFLGIRTELIKKGFTMEAGKYRDVAIRTERWKYILRLSRERLEQISWWAEVSGTPISFPEAELYDLQNDPGETKNVIADYPQEAATLRMKLETWYAKEKASAPETQSVKTLYQPYF